MRTQHIVLISCVKQKLGIAAPAGELYVSPLFKMSLEYARALKPEAIYVLSAKHGLLFLDSIINPYEETLNRKSGADIRKWAQYVIAQLEDVADLESDRFTILAGEKYRKHLLTHIKNFVIPMKGLTIGRQLQFLSKQHRKKSRSGSNSIKDKLVNRGKALLRAKRKEVDFTNDSDANALINNIERYPHAYVLGCVADRQVKAEVAWAVPYHLASQLGTFEFEPLASLSKSDFRNLMKGSGHRFWKTMAELYFLAIKRIREDYGGDASRIWTGSPSSATVVYRFLQFKGIGQKIATMAANVLARRYKILMSDYYSVDISADRHIKRVFKRLHLVSQDATNEQIIFLARSLHPDYPGLMDFPCYEIGRNWCKPTNPFCADCFMNDCCPTNES